MGSIWIVRDGHAFLGRGRVALLEEIDSTGSISEAARHMGMSYKKAWRLVEAMNTLAAVPLVVRTSGGIGGGGTTLTERGRQLVDAFHSIEAEYNTFLDSVMERNMIHNTHKQ
jgi:molybdate transport system regulatory protein